MPKKPARISTSDICTAIQVTPETVREWRDRGMPATKIKGAWAYDEDEVCDWLVDEGIASRPAEQPWPTYTNKRRWRPFWASAHAR